MPPHSWKARCSMQAPPCVMVKSPRQAAACCVPQPWATRFAQPSRTLTLWQRASNGTGISIATTSATARSPASRAKVEAAHRHDERGPAFAGPLSFRLSRPFEKPPAKPIAVLRDNGLRKPLEANELLVPAPQVAVLGLGHQEQADKEGHYCHDDRVPQAVVDVPWHGHDGECGSGQEAAEPAVADMVRERHGGISDARREQLYQ